MRSPASRVLSCVLAAAALALAGCPSPPSQTAGSFRASVAVRTIDRGRIERTIVTTGTVRALSSAKAITEAAGQLTVARNPRTGRRWAIGDDVRRGELLARIAPDEMATQARLEARRRALQAAEADHRRHHELHAQGLISSLQMAEQDTRLANAQADMDAADLQHSKSRLVSPITGVVTTVTTSPDGELVAERVTLAEVMEFGELIVDLDLSAGDILAVTAGQDARISLPGTDHSVMGTVARTAPAIDPRTRTFRVEVALPNEGRLMRPGMFVRAEIVVEAKDGVVLVPAEAVVLRQGLPVVFVVEAQRAMRRPVSPGLATDEWVEILEGAQPGQQVVVSGQDTLDDAADVVVRE